MPDTPDMPEFRSQLEDLAEYAVNEAALTPDVMAWAQQAPKMFAEYRISKALGFDSDQAMAFIYARHLAK